MFLFENWQNCKENHCGRLFQPLVRLLSKFSKCAGLEIAKLASHFRIIFKKWFEIIWILGDILPLELKNKFIYCIKFRKWSWNCFAWISFRKLFSICSNFGEKIFVPNSKFRKINSECLPIPFEKNSSVFGRLKWMEILARFKILFLANNANFPQTFLNSNRTENIAGGGPQKFSRANKLYTNLTTPPK